MIMKKTLITFIKILVVFIIITFFISGDYLLKFFHTPTDLEIRDKENISKSLLDDIEAIRKERICYYEHKASSDTGVFTYRYQDVATQLNKYVVAEKREDIISIPVYDYLSIIVDHIAYSDDSLKCFSNIIIDNHIPPEIKAQYYEHEYDGIGVIGIRESTNEKFDLYPYPPYAVGGFPSPITVSHALYKKFSSSMERDRVAADVIFNSKSLKGFKDPDFFNKSPMFMVDSLGNYGCQFVLYGDKLRPVSLFSNKRKVNLPANHSYDKYGPIIYVKQKNFLTN